MDLRALLLELLSLFRRHWPALLRVHVAASVLAALLLAPLLTIAIGLLVLLSGEVALSDEDILRFALSPAGLLALVAGLALFVTVQVFEQAALFVTAYRARSGHATGLAALFRFLLARAAALFELSARMVLRALLIASPFLVCAGLAYGLLLTEFDINYYLSARPREFWVAGGLIALCVAGLLWALLPILAGWVMALPLLLLERGKPAAVLRQSRQLAGPLRLPVALMLLCLWLLNSALLALTGLLLDGGLALLAKAAGSLGALAVGTALLLLVWSLAGLAVTFVTRSSLALGILGLFLRLFPGRDRARLAERLSLGRPPAAAGPPAGLPSWAPPAAIAGLLLLGFAVFRFAAQQVQPADLPEIVAHRGASRVAPENTLAAVQAAIDRGADWIEIDVQETREGEVLVIHDRDLMRVGRSALPVRDTPLGVLREVDIGSWKDPRFADQRVPTLREVLSLARDRIRVTIELKYYGAEQRLESRVAGIVEELGMEDQVVFMSLSLAGVRTMKALRPDWTVGLLSSVAVGNETRLGVDFFAVNGRFASRRFIRQAQARDRSVLVWTINAPVDVAAMAGKGVDGIITDRPAMAREALTQWSELDLAGRLLLRFASVFEGKIAGQ